MDSDPYDTIDLGEQLGRQHDEQYGEQNDDQYCARQGQDMDDEQSDEQPYEQHEEDMDDEQHAEAIDDEDMHGVNVDDIPMHSFTIHIKPFSYGIDFLNRGPINTFTPSTFINDRATSAEPATPTTPSSTSSMGSPAMPATPDASMPQTSLDSAMPATPYAPAAWPGTTGRSIGWEGMSRTEIQRTLAEWDKQTEQKEVVHRQRDWDEMSEPLDGIPYYIYLRELREMDHRRRDLAGLAYEPTPPLSFLRDEYPAADLSSGSIHGDMDSGEVIRQQFRENLEAYVVYSGGPHWCAGEVSEGEYDDLPPCKRRRLR